MKKNKEKNNSNSIVLGKYNDLPSYLLDNEYIKEGYLTNVDSYSKAIQSLFIFNNETINVWSHILGSIYIILIIFNIPYQIKLYKLNENEDDLNIFPFYIFLCSAFLCLSFSATYHLFGNMSLGNKKLLSHLDFGGISLLITGTCFPCIFYFYYCNRVLRNILLLIIILFGLSLFFYTLSDNFYLPKNRSFRGKTFILFGIMAGFPVFEKTIYEIFFSEKSFDLRLFFWYLGGISYFSGALIYVFRFPEKIYPGKFDYIGASHQILHILDIVGITFHLLALFDSYKFRYIFKC